MKIVIDIPDNVYGLLRYFGVAMGLTDKANKKDDKVKIVLMRAIVHGTPLPKGHGDLIDVSRKITVSTYDEQYEEWGEETMTVLEALNKWSDEGVGIADVVIPADKEGEDDFD